MAQATNILGERRFKMKSQLPAITHWLKPSRQVGLLIELFRAAGTPEVTRCTELSCAMLCPCSQCAEAHSVSSLRNRKILCHFSCARNCVRACLRLQLQAAKMALQEPP